MEGKEEKNIDFYNLLSIFKIYSLPNIPMDFYCLFKLDYNLNACKYAFMFRGPE